MFCLFRCNYNLPNIPPLYRTYRNNRTYRYLCWQINDLISLTKNLKNIEKLLVIISQTLIISFSKFSCVFKRIVIKIHNLNNRCKREIFYVNILAFTTVIHFAEPTPDPGPRPDCPADTDPIQFYPVANNCSQFWECFLGNLYLMSCPSGQVWNTDANYCDFPDNVDCNRSK